MVRTSLQGKVSSLLEDPSGQTAATLPPTVPSPLASHQRTGSQTITTGGVGASADVTMAPSSVAPSSLAALMDSNFRLQHAPMDEAAQ